MHLTVAITGASGAILGRELLRALEADARVARVHFVASENSLRVLAEELGISGRNDLLEKLLGAVPTKTVQHADADIGAAIASGSHPVEWNDHPAVLHGHAGQNRARPRRLADRPRRRRCAEGAASAYSLRARDALQSHSPAQYDAGRRSRSTIFPCIPAFYNHPIDSKEMARQFACRVLAHIGLPQPGAYVWKPEK